MASVRRVLRLRPTALGMYRISAAIRLTSSRVPRSTGPELFRTLETVAMDTPALRATSLIVTLTVRAVFRFVFLCGPVKGKVVNVYRVGPTIASR